MEAIPIQNLDPGTAPPGEGSIRAIVTLSWPFSSSTKQCALLLAETDFRLRSRKGQVRVRFTGASAEAVAKSRIGIGDVVELALEGAVWAGQDKGTTRSPGRSVDGELVFGRRLQLRIAKPEGEVDVSVDAPQSPQQAEGNVEDIVMATPLLSGGASRLRSSLNGLTESVPIYSSPAFAKRLRLSGESFSHSAYDPFVDDLVADQPNKKQRTSFGGVGQWRYAVRTPSPVNDALGHDIERGPDQQTVTEGSQAGAVNILDSTHENNVGSVLPGRLPSPMNAPPETADPPPVQDPVIGTEEPRHPASHGGSRVTIGDMPEIQQQASQLFANMPPPPLPHLHMPDVLDHNQTQDIREGDDDQQDSPSTPKLQAVPNSSLPLPSPFPMEAAQQRFEVEEHVTPPDVPAELLVEDESDDGLNSDEDEDMLHESVEVAKEDTQGTVDDVFEPLETETQIGDKKAFEKAQKEYNERIPAVGVSNALHDPEPHLERRGTQELLPSSPLFSLPRTPVKIPPSEFSLDGTASVALHPQSTPQSERDRIMAQTFRSLFGFQAQPESQARPLEQPEVVTPTPMFGLSDMARARFGAAAPAQRMKSSNHVKTGVAEKRPAETAADQTAQLNQIGDPEAARSVAGELPAIEISETDKLSGVTSQSELVQLPDDIAPATEQEHEARVKDIAPVVLPETQQSRPPRPSTVTVIELGSSSDAEDDNNLPQDHITDTGENIKIEYAEPDVEQDDPGAEAGLSSPLATSQLEQLETEIMQLGDEAVPLYSDADSTGLYVPTQMVSSPPDTQMLEPGPTAQSDTELDTSHNLLEERPAVQRQHSDDMRHYSVERVIEDSQDEVSGSLSTQPSPTADDEAKFIAVPEREPERKSSNDSGGTATPLTYVDEDTQSMDTTPTAPPALDVDQQHKSPRSTAQTVVIELGSSSPVAEIAPSPQAVEETQPALVTQIRTDGMGVKPRSPPNVAESAPSPAMTEAVSPPLTQVRIDATTISYPQGEHTGDDFMDDMLEADMLASPPPDIRWISVDSELEAVAQVNDGMSAVDLESETPTSPAQSQRFNLAESELESASGVSQVSPEADDVFEAEVTSESNLLPTQEEATNPPAFLAAEPVSCPTLPPSPLASQPQEETHSAQAAQLAYSNTVRSILPPTPQLTQRESDLQGVVPEPVLSQQSSAPLTQPVDSEAGSLEAPSVSQTPMHVSPLQDGEAIRPEPPVANQGPTHTSLHISSSTSHGVDLRDVEQEVRPQVKQKMPARKSLTARLSNVPDVISAWFSPKRVSEVAQEAPTKTKAFNEDREAVTESAVGVSEAEGLSSPTTNGHIDHADARPKLVETMSNGVSTSLGYFTPLSRLEEQLNPSSQQVYGINTVDVLAVVANSTKAPERAKGGPRDFFTFFCIIEASLPAGATVRAEVFRPWKAKLPIADVGDVVLLRAFAVKSRSRQPYLLSTDTSSWCVWRYADAKAGHDNGEKPVWARRRSGSFGSSSREEVTGPPVELGEEERNHVKALREWWVALHPEAGLDRPTDGHEDTEVDGLISPQLKANL